MSGQHEPDRRGTPAGGRENTHAAVVQLGDGLLAARARLLGARAQHTAQHRQRLHVPQLQVVGEPAETGAGVTACCVTTCGGQSEATLMFVCLFIYLFVCLFVGLLGWCVDCRIILRQCSNAAACHQTHQTHAHTHARKRTHPPRKAWPTHTDSTRRRPNGCCAHGRPASGSALEPTRPGSPTRPIRFHTWTGRRAVRWPSHYTLPADPHFQS